MNFISTREIHLFIYIWENIDFQRIHVFLDLSDINVYQLVIFLYCFRPPIFPRMLIDLSITCLSGYHTAAKKLIRSDAT